MTRYATEQERLQAWADRRNKRAAERNPLFAAAGALEEVAHIYTAEECRQENEAKSESLRRGVEELARHADAMRVRYIELAGPEAVAEADGRWAQWSGPRTAHYRADFWWQRLREEMCKMPREQRCALCREFQPKLAAVCEFQKKWGRRRREAARGQQLQMQLMEASELRAARKGRA